MVLCLVGMPGSGKTTATEVFRNKKLAIIKLGKYTEEERIKRNLSLTWANERRVRNSIRKEFGEIAYIKRFAADIYHFLSQNQSVVVEGIRSIAEMDYLRSIADKLIIIYIESNPEVRHNRLIKRKSRLLTIEEIDQRDSDEKKLGLEKIKKYADYIIENNQSIVEFKNKISRLLDKIYD